MRILIDTNCLLMCTPRRAEHHWLFQAVRNGVVHLIVITEILLEYEEQLGLFYSPEYARLILNAILELPDTIELNPIPYTWGIITTDPDDNKFVDAAILGSAEWIVTNDRHFKALEEREFPKVNHIKLVDFQKLITDLPEKLF